MVRIKNIKFYDNFSPKKVELKMYDAENKSDQFNVICTFNKTSLLCQIPKLNVKCELVEPEDLHFNYITLCAVGHLHPRVSLEIARAVACSYIMLQ